MDTVPTCLAYNVLGLCLLTMPQKIAAYPGAYFYYKNKQKPQYPPILEMDIRFMEYAFDRRSTMFSDQELQLPRGGSHLATLGSSCDFPLVSIREQFS